MEQQPPIQSVLPKTPNRLSRLKSRGASLLKPINAKLGGNNKLQPLVFVAAFAVMGAAALFLTHAQAPSNNTISIEGEVFTSHEDDFAHGKSTTRYNIKTKDDVYYQLEQGGADYSKLHEKQRVKIMGIPTKEGHRIKPTKIEAVTDSQSQSLQTQLFPKAEAAKPIPPPTPPPTPPPASSKKVLVILFNFKNDRTKPFTTTQARQTVFTANNSSNAYLKETSYNKLGLTGRDRVDGDVAGWYTVDYNNTSCDEHNWAKSALNKAKAARVDTSGYDTIMFVYSSFVADCPYDGQFVPAYNFVHVNGPKAFTTFTTSHELGHSLGLSHANSFSCVETGAVVPITINLDYKFCVEKEYNDPFDSMGGHGLPRHYNAYHKAQLGWLTNIQTVAGDGDYTIVPLEKLSTGIQMLRVPTRSAMYKADYPELGPITQSYPQYYYIEYRQPYGFDDASASGLTVRLGADYVFQTPITSAGPMTRLLDATPATNTFEDAQLAPSTLIDDGEVTIKLISQSATSATVQITRRGTVIPTNLLVTEKYDSSTEKRSLLVAWQAPTNFNAVGYTIYRDGVQIGNSNSTSFNDPNVFQPAPEQVFEGLHEERYTYTVKAYDSAGNYSPESAPYNWYTNWCTYAC
ncbi:MAG: hypothetical protein V4702_00970 [Patescibacteria group bacterium]